MRIMSLWALTISLGFCCVVDAHADAFGSGGNAFDMEFSLIAATGNSADTTAAWTSAVGAVAYEYRMGRYEVSEDMINKANTAGGLGITHDNRGPTMPATSITWIEAAKFVNWLNASTGNSPAYKIDALNILHVWAPNDAGYDVNNKYRNSQAKYVLPSANEWHKAAYYDPQGLRWWDYPSGSDAPPDGLDSATDANYEAVFKDSFITIPGPKPVDQVGVSSQFAVEGLGGNVWEWEETDFDLVNDLNMNDHGLRGGYWNGGSIFLASVSRTPNNRGNASDNIGFRVVALLATPPPAGDLNGDGAVDGRDFLDWQRSLSISPEDLRAWMDNYGERGGDAIAVPEPRTQLIAVVASGAWRMRRRIGRRFAASKNEKLPSATTFINRRRLAELLTSLRRPEFGSSAAF